MNEENQVSVDVTLDDKAYNKTLDSLNKKTEAFGKSAIQSFNKMDVAFSVFAGNLAASAVEKTIGVISSVASNLTDILIEGASAAAEDEKAFSQFNNALALSGKYSKEASKGFEEFASEMERTRNIADGTVANVGRVVSSMTQLDAVAIQRVIKSSADLSAAFGRDFEGSAEVVAKAVNGQVGALNKLGFQFEDTGSKSKNLENILSEIESRFGGSSLKSVENFQGGVDKTNISIDNLKESFGQTVINAAGLGNIFSFVAGKVNETNDAFNRNNLAITAFISGTTEGLLRLTGIVLNVFDAFGAFFNLIINTGTMAFTGFNLIISEFVAGSIGLLLKIPMIAETSVGQGLKSAYDSIDSYSRGLIKSIEKDQKDISDSLNNVGFAGKLGLELDDLADKIKNNAFVYLEDANNYKNSEASKSASLSSELEKRLQMQIDNDLAMQNLIATREEIELQRRLAQKEIANQDRTEELNQLFFLEQEKIRITFEAQEQKANMIKDQSEKNLMLQKIAYDKETALLKSKSKFEESEMKRMASVKKMQDQQTLDSTQFIIGQALQFTKEGSLAQQALAITQATISTFLAATKALEAGPIAGPILSSMIYGLGMANVAKIAGAKFENGGIVGGNSLTGDRIPVRVNSQEMILNRQQQTELFRIANGQSSGSNVVDAIYALGDRIENMNIVVQANSREIARLVREESRGGFSFA